MRQERDSNGDGRYDVSVLFDAEERPAREEFDTNFDGTPDVLKHYQAGVVTREEADRDFDGRFELVSKYTQRA